MNPAEIVSKIGFLVLGLIAAMGVISVFQVLFSDKSDREKRTFADGWARDMAHIHVGPGEIILFPANDVYRVVIERISCHTRPGETIITNTPHVFIPPKSERLLCLEFEKMHVPRLMSAVIKEAARISKTKGQPSGKKNAEKQNGA